MRVVASMKTPLRWGGTPKPRLQSPPLAIEVTVATEASGADTRVVPVFEGESLDGALQALVDSGEAKPAPKKTAVFHEDGGRTILAGAGKRADADAERFRVAAAAAASRAKELGAKSLAWDVPDVAGASAGIVQGTLLALYSFDRFKSKKDEGGIGALELVGGSEDEAAAAQAEA